LCVIVWVITEYDKRRSGILNAPLDMIWDITTIQWYREIEISEPSKHEPNPHKSINPDYNMT
jgi:hypothetical protein